MRKAKLIESSDLSPSVRGLTFCTEDGRPVGHAAGQHLDLVVPTARGLPYRRPYSIASGPDALHPDRFEIAVTRVQGGPTSEALHAMVPGALVEIEGPRGTFVRRAEDRGRPGIFVATGTGLAPIRAMLAEEVAQPGPPLVLLFGCRTPCDELWAEQLRRWQSSWPRFRAHVTLSRPPAGWPGLTGYVQRHAPALAASLPGACAYVCGLSAMVDDVVKILSREAGLPAGAVRYETYD